MTDHPPRDRVERWIDLPAPAAEVWALIGPFGAIADWHPAVADAEIVDLEGETHRHLTLADGEKLLERLVEEGDHLYRYEIVEGPLPVEEYRATLTCFSEGSGCRVFWSSTFESEDPAADALIAGIYEAGLEALQRRFG